MKDTAPKLLVCLSHKLTDDQLLDARLSLGIPPENVFTLPENLQEVWQNVPVESLVIHSVAKSFVQWIKSGSAEGDYVLIQGHFGLSFALVEFCLRRHRIPIYAVTRRISTETPLSDGSIRISKTFKHVAYEKYQTLP